MAKFYGQIGFKTTQEVSPGVHENVIVERPYYGDIIRDAVDRVAGETVLGDRKTGNSFRIVADGYISSNFFDAEYIVWGGRYWKIIQVEVQTRARMHVRIGGVYNGPRATPGTP